MDRQFAFAMPIQRRNTTRESRALHAAVLALRKAGIRVQREGRHHAINGKRVSAYWVKRLARGAAT